MLLLLQGYDSTKRVPNFFNTTHSTDMRTAPFRIFTRIMYLLRINYYYLPCCTYRGPVELWAVSPRFGDSSVPKRYGLQLPHGYFRFGSGLMPFFVKFYGSLMVYGYGSVKPRVLSDTVKPRLCTAVLKP